MSEYAPLSDIRVLDLSDIQGAYCSKVLGDLGADVVKIEPLNGDSVRKVGPFAGDVVGLETSLTFAYYNANKRGITLDLWTSRGKEIFLEMIKGFDVLIESFGPGIMEELGLGYSRLKSINKGIVMTSITPFGQDGPCRDHKGTELTLLAAGGITYMCGEPESDPCTAPSYKAYDLASTWAASGILISLHHRQRTGEGQFQDISILESVASTSDWVVARMMHEGVNAKRNGATAATYWPSGLYESKDGKYLMLFTLTSGQFRAFADWTGREDLKDSMWEDRDVRIENVDYLREIYSEFVVKFKREDFIEEAQRRESPVTPVHDVGEFQENDHEVAREFFQESEHPVIGSFSYPGLPVVLGEQEKPRTASAPLLGQHNEDIYVGELGMSKSELAELVTSRVA
jgi:crotonobetainyl-CoA:carnitine CoA-transferase CaiB-like acyl-CoA transferase